MRFFTRDVNQTTVHNVIVKNRFDREAGITFVQANLSIEGCKLRRPRTNNPKDPVVILVTGSGFQKPDDGSIAVTGDNVQKVDSAWRAHTQWEVQLSNSEPQKPIKVSKMTVVNEIPAKRQEDLTDLQKLGVCANIGPVP